MEQIRSLATTDIDTVASAFAEAFSDYERIRTAEEYKKMLKRRGYVPELSFGAFEGDKLVSFTLNGIGMFNGKNTAYDTGTGTIKEYRGRKLAGRIFETSVPHLRERGVEQYLLEVLQSNCAAISVYSAQGFTVSRELNYYFQQRDELQLRHKSLPHNISFRKASLQPEIMQAMWDFTPSWQNSFESIDRVKNEFVAIGAYDGDQIIGYGIIEPAGGDIAQLAVDNNYRRRGIGTVLMRELVQQSHSDRIQVINVESTASSAAGFFEAIGFSIRGQ